VIELTIEKSELNPELRREIQYKSATQQWWRENKCWLQKKNFKKERL